MTVTESGFDIVIDQKPIRHQHRYSAGTRAAIPSLLYLDEGFGVHVDSSIAFAPAVSGSGIDVPDAGHPCVADPIPGIKIGDTVDGKPQFG